MHSKPKAYSYVRFSSPEQARGDSRRRQSKAAMEYAAKHGLELIKDADYSFSDFGVSAYRGDNVNRVTSSLGRFYEYVKTGKIEPGSYLLVESLDRLSREQVTEALRRFLDLLDAGIIVVTFGDGTVYKKSPDPMQLIMSIFHMSRAHSESEWKGNRISQAWQNKQALARSHKKPLGAVCPQWLFFDGEKYCVDESRANVVKRVFQLTIQGYGQRAILKMFNTEGVPVFGTPKRNKSGLWGTSSIAKILSNRAVIGEYQPTVWKDGKRQPAGDVVTDFYPSVITEDVFYAAWDGRVTRKISKSTKQMESFNVWSKIAVCSNCASPMHVVNKGAPPKGGNYLRCSRSAKGMCDNRSIKFDQCETVFRELITKVASASLVKDNAAALRKKVSELNGKIESLGEKLKELADLIMEFPSKSLAESIAKIEVEIQVHSEARLKYTQELASEHIIDKADFLNRLNLHSYDGRYLANQQIRRLELKVLMLKNELRSQFVASIKGMPRFVFMWDHGESLKFVPLSAESLRASIRQGDMQYTAFITSPDRLVSSAMAGSDMPDFAGNLPEKLQVTNFKFTPEAEEQAHKKLIEYLFGDDGVAKPSKDKVGPSKPA
ncbi:recombinase family protein [Stutzerimonas nitrititolerans]|uniref:recombinase family protein n=1 Tax=Stutzerimonas nitrititolerans TaxID=2482751 RepID=UPI0028AD6905|nr:recombinase family protein [Stutzerimonas nitrititolerans]